jgi:hypothetical protein
MGSDPVSPKLQHLIYKKNNSIQDNKYSLALHRLFVGSGSNAAHRISQVTQGDGSLTRCNSGVVLVTLGS